MAQLVYAIARLAAIIRYLLAVATDGDYLNDWLSHLDHETAARVEVFGHALARLAGL